jgi:hypothetical protein
MTKSEKKEIVFHLVEDFKASNDVSELKVLEKKIIKEVSDCPFSDEVKEVLELSLLSWTNDIDDYILDKERGGACEHSNYMAITSIAGIYNFIDVSLLEEEEI